MKQLTFFEGALPEEGLCAGSLRLSERRLIQDALRAYLPALLRDLEGCWSEKRRLAGRRDYLVAHPEATKDEEEGFLEEYRLAQQVEDDRIRWTQQRIAFLRPLL